MGGDGGDALAHPTDQKQRQSLFHLRSIVAVMRVASGCSGLITIVHSSGTTTDAMAFSKSFQDSRITMATQMPSLKQMSRQLKSA